MIKSFSLTLNGTDRTVDAEEDTPLLYILRNQFELNGPKFGCGLQQCGSCMVLMNGQAVPSCGITIAAADNQQITTLEGLISADGDLHPLQEAFIEKQAAQCGYCLNGMVISAAAILQKTPDASEEDIRQQLRINICRCGTHQRIIDAIKSVDLS
ncbi:MAG: (2Fe-2S)-binding protein [Cyclobacteriaceae bacterium]